MAMLMILLLGAVVVAGNKCGPEAGTIVLAGGVIVAAIAGAIKDKVEADRVDWPFAALLFALGIILVVAVSLW